MAIAAIRAGAYDFVTKPLDRVEVLTAGGVGYELEIPLGVFEKLPAEGETVELRTRDGMRHRPGDDDLVAARVGDPHGQVRPGSAARLANREHRLPLRAQPLGEEPQLRRLSGALGTLAEQARDIAYDREQSPPAIELLAEPQRGVGCHGRH